MKKIFFHTMAFSIFFIIFYVETIEVGPFKIAILWKSILVLFMLIYIIFDKSTTKIFSFALFGYLYSIKNLMSLSSFVNLPSTISLVIKHSFIFLFFHFFSLLKKNRNLNIYNLLLIISLYIIMSTIPFLLNIVKPLTIGYNLSILGLDEPGFIGIFQKPSGASITISFALLVLIFHVLNTKLNFIKKTFFLSIIFIGLWGLIQTYARTGYVILLIGFVYLFFNKKNILFYLKALIPILLLSLGVVYYYNNNEALQMRIEGKTIYSSSDVSPGSGRIKFAYHAFDNWYSSDIGGLLIGLGKELALDMMKKDVGLRIYAHNGFLDVLQFNGLIGVTLYLLFLFFLIRFLLNNRKNIYYKLNITIFLGYLVSQLFQGERYFLADLIFGVSLTLLTTTINNNSKGEKYGQISKC